MDEASGSRPSEAVTLGWMEGGARDRPCQEVYMIASDSLLLPTTLKASNQQDWCSLIARTVIYLTLS